jgi:hypothetical protein
VNCCHVVAFLPDLDRVLAIPTAAGWLLPHIDGSWGPGFTRGVEGMVASSLDAKADVVHVAPLSFEASGRGSHWYCLVVVSAPAVSSPIAAMPPSTLLATPPLLPTQAQALRLALKRLLTPDAPFDSPARVADALQWAEQQTRERTGAQVVTVARHRCSRYDYVVRLHTTAGIVYFKGGTGRVQDEGALTQLLHGLSPQLFPDTLAIDQSARRWIYRELAGESLHGSAFAMDRVLTAVSALASMQKAALTVPAVQAHLSDSAIDATQLFDRVNHAVQQAWHTASDDTAGRGFDRWCAERDDIRSTCEAIDGWGVPLTLTLSDFWTPNLIWNSSTGVVGFIDVERSYWAPPVLSLWRLVSEMEKRLGKDCQVRERIEETFIRAWADVIDPKTMRGLLATLPFLGQLFATLLIVRSLDSRVQALGAELPPGYRANELAPHISRFLRAVPMTT